MTLFPYSRSAALVALGLLVAVPTLAQSRSPRVTVDNAPVPFTGQQPIDNQGHVLVPLRGVFEKMGAKVGYDAPSRKITAKSDKFTIEMNVGSSTATVNGQPMTLDAPVKITNGAVLVPIRFLSESLGSSVKFDKDSQTVLVDTSKTPAPSQGAPAVAGVQMAQATPEPTPVPQSQPAQPVQTMPVPTQTMPVQTAPAPVQTAPAPVPAARQPQAVTVVDPTPVTSYAWVPWVIAALVLLGALAWYLNRRGKTGQVIAANDEKRP